ncbi:hypothetical protein A3860_24080 [Niastella vici]|uniref:Uncharacterized protein n=1 Tax=Niastella vici TaxID=1703345 RepID=A0A1V9FYV8_9BACT|nr:hypothetical protein [Niastella vici]OQP63426.1 hypothetical protein A3860_24080 [Niastella vici]
MISTTHATREVMRESDRDVYNTATGTHTRIFDLYMTEANGHYVNTLHYIHLFDPIFTDTVNQLITGQLGSAFSEEADEKKWNRINSSADTGGELGILVANGSITINYTGHKERSTFTIELLKNLIKDIDERLQGI